MLWDTIHRFITFVCMSTIWRDITLVFPHVNKGSKTKWNSSFTQIRPCTIRFVIIHLKSDWYGHCHFEPLSLFSSDLCHETKYFRPQSSPRGHPRRSAVSGILNLSLAPAIIPRSKSLRSHFIPVLTVRTATEISTLCLHAWKVDSQSHMIDWLDMNALTSKCTLVAYYVVRWSRRCYSSSCGKSKWDKTSIITTSKNRNRAFAEPRHLFEILDLG